MSSIRNAVGTKTEETPRETGLGKVDDYNTKLEYNKKNPIVLVAASEGEQSDQSEQAEEALVVQIPDVELEEFTVPQIEYEFKFSLWTDLCGEQTEFFDALEYISSF